MNGKLNYANYNNNAKNLGVYELVDKQSKKNLNQKPTERNFGKDLKNIKVNKPNSSYEIHTSKDSKQVNNKAIISKLIETIISSDDDSDSENKVFKDNMSKTLKTKDKIPSRNKAKGKYRKKNDTKEELIIEAAPPKSIINGEDKSELNNQISKTVKGNKNLVKSEEEFKLSNNKEFRLQHCILDTLLKKNKQYVTEHILEIFEHLLLTEVRFYINTYNNIIFVLILLYNRTKTNRLPIF